MGKKLKNIGSSVVAIYAVIGVIVQQVVEQIDALPDDAGIVAVLAGALAAIRQVTPVVKDQFGWS